MAIEMSSATDVLGNPKGFKRDFRFLPSGPSAMATLKSLILKSERGDLRVTLQKTLKPKILKSCYHHREMAEKMKSKMSKNLTIFFLNFNRQ